jgi:O-antigen/teichoic acid export membrane protein
MSLPEREPGTRTEPIESARVWSAFARSVRDNVLAEVAIQGIRVSAMIILARELTPRDFGVFKILVIIGMIGILIYEAGIPASLIKQRVLKREHESTAWWISFSLAFLSAGCLWLGAPIMAALMKMPELTVGARLLCIPILLEGSVVISNARLQRSLRFGMLALADLAGAIVFLAVALAVAAHGMPMWSLPIALAARLATHAIAIWIGEPRGNIGLPRLAAAKDLLQFSTSVSGGQFLYLISSNISFLLIGRLLGSSALGFYTIALDLLRFVPDRLHQVAGRVLYPAFCKFQDDNEALSKAYLDFFNYVSRIVLPVVAVSVIAAPEIVSSVYGHKWLPAAEPLRLLAAGLGVGGLRVAIGSVYYSKGYPSIDVYLHTFRIVLIVIAVVSCTRYGLLGVSAAVSAAEAIVTVVGLWFACYLIELDITQLIVAALPGARLAAVCAVCALVAKEAAHSAGLEGFLALLLIASSTLVAYGWLEGRTLIGMISTAFGNASLGTVDS